jgi:hypothetical protein
MSALSCGSIHIREAADCDKNWIMTINGIAVAVAVNVVAVAASARFHNQTQLDQKERDLP